MGRVFLLIAVWLFWGCQGTPSLLHPDPLYLEAMRHTQKGDITLSLENKALIIATYLNPMEEGDRKEERFFVRVYIDNDFEESNRSGLFHPGFKIALNGYPPTKIETIDHQHLLAKTMPFTQRWYRLYLVHFPAIAEDRLTLRFWHRDYGSALLAFEKSLQD
ncbi:MAG: hypothetical protein C6I00_02375 [Nitratiruptor sp.]|nr:hypothetical protein [Nitratiruptor sp.]NPA84132.1 hypothetical protein [Campylobacterota bacterium]